MSELAAETHTSPAQVAARPGSWSRFAPAALILLMGVSMAGWTWNTWPDVFIDFGRELYLAWQIAEGRALYHDLAYFSGPLSPHVNALGFAVFGVGLRTIVWMNLALLVILLGLLYRIIREVSDTFTATAACLLFLVAFAFGQNVYSANYNYLCPYSHEMTHGLLLSLFAIYSLHRRSDRPRIGFDIAAGVAIGLVFLTRAEVFTACLVAVVACAVLNKSPAKRRGGDWAALVGCAIAPALIAWACLSTRMPAAEALAGLLSSWTTAMNPRIGSLAFFREGMGIDKPLQNFLSMLQYAGAFVAIMLPALWAAWWWKRRSALAPAIAACIAYGLAGGGEFVKAARILPFLMIALVYFLWRARKVADSRRRSRLGLAIAMALFAFVLTGKMILNCRIYQYGFVLAMPATMMLVVLLLYWLPSWLDTIGRSGALFRGAAVGVLFTISIACLILTNHYIGRKHTSVGTGSDTFFADNRGPSANIVLSEILPRLGPGQTFGVLPEGVMLNYLARVPTGWRHSNFMPTEIALFGETAMLADLQAHPPDYLVLIHKETSEFGFRFFGKDYGQKIMAWINQNYVEMGVVGARPFVDPFQFGVLLMQRRPAAAP